MTASLLEGFLSDLFMTSNHRAGLSSDLSGYSVALSQPNKPVAFHTRRGGLSCLEKQLKMSCVDFHRCHIPPWRVCLDCSLSLVRQETFATRVFWKPTRDSDDLTECPSWRLDGRKLSADIRITSWDVVGRMTAPLSLLFLLS